MSRYHLCHRGAPARPAGAARGAALADHCRAMLERHARYVREHLEDMPEVRDWRWTEP